MKKIVTILVSLFLLFSLTGCGKDTKTNKTNNNKKNEQSSNIFLQDKVVNTVVGDLSFENFAITKDSTNNYVIFFNIANRGDKSINVKKVKVILYSEGVTVLSLDVDVNKTLTTDEEFDVSENIDVELKDIDQVEYVVE
ncbi:MAG: hypothetical protein IJ715_00500 [Bacilli bacterium]|nr:hypothetical protein [Bacilli bacterium]